MENTNALPRTAAPVRLEIAGGGLLLSGTFDHWMPMLIDGTVDEQNSAQLLVDVTSQPGLADVTPAAPLFTFRSRSVKALGAATFRAQGKLETAGRQHKLEAIIQTADGHTPFFLLTLGVPREGFADVWQAFESRVKREAEGSDEVRAQAWLRPPDVAAA